MHPLVRVSIVLSSVVAVASIVQAMLGDLALSAAVHAGVAAVVVVNTWVLLRMNRLRTEAAIALVRTDVLPDDQTQKDNSQFELMSLQSRVDQHLSVLAPLIDELEKSAQGSVRAMEHASVIAQEAGSLIEKGSNNTKEASHAIERLAEFARGGGGNLS